MRNFTDKVVEEHLRAQIKRRFELDLSTHKFCINCVIFRGPNYWELDCLFVGDKWGVVLKKLKVDDTGFPFENFIMHITHYKV